jgi:hypothetical protein
MTDEEVTSFHEAAHAIVATDMGAKHRRSTIVEFEEDGREISGRTNYSIFGDDDYLELFYVVAYAGVVAQKRVCGDTYGCKGDLKRMDELLTDIANRDGLNVEGIVDTKQALEQATEERVTRLWPQIETFAQRLLTLKTIAGELVGTVSPAEFRGSGELEQACA